MTLIVTSGKGYPLILAIISHFLPKQTVFSPDSCNLASLPFKSRSMEDFKTRGNKKKKDPLQIRYFHQDIAIICSCNHSAEMYLFFILIYFNDLQIAPMMCDFVLYFRQYHQNEKKKVKENKKKIGGRQDDRKVILI